MSRKRISTDEEVLDNLLFSAARSEQRDSMLERLAERDKWHHDNEDRIAALVVEIEEEEAAARTSGSPIFAHASSVFVWAHNVLKGAKCALGKDIDVAVYQTQRWVDQLVPHHALAVSRGTRRRGSSDQPAKPDSSEETGWRLTAKPLMLKGQHVLFTATFPGAPADIADSAAARVWFDGIDAPSVTIESTTIPGSIRIVAEPPTGFELPEVYHCLVAGDEEGSLLIDLRTQQENLNE